MTLKPIKEDKIRLIQDFPDDATLEDIICMDFNN